jgi:hypothetical protein
MAGFFFLEGGNFLQPLLERGFVLVGFGLAGQFLEFIGLSWFFDHGARGVNRSVGPAVPDLQIFNAVP